MALWKDADVTGDVWTCPQWELRSGPGLAPGLASLLILRTVCKSRVAVVADERASVSDEKVEIEKPQRWSSNTKVWPKTINPARTGPADVAPSCKHARYRAVIWLFKAPETPELLLVDPEPAQPGWGRVCVGPAGDVYAGIGPGLRASLLGSRENGGLIPLREPRVGGDRYAVAVIPAGHVITLAS